MNEPLVSVLLPVWNGEDHLDEAMESLVGQTVDDQEILVVDDGSTDATPRILREWVRRDARVRVVTTGHFGIVAALEAARDCARGRFLARLDADDVAAPTRFERQVQLMEAEPELVGCGCHTSYFPRESVTGGALRYEAWLHSIRSPADLDRNLYVECPLSHPTFFLRPAAVTAVGGYQERGWPEDYDLLQRLRLQGQLGVVPEVLLNWRDRPERLSRTGADYSESAFRQCKLHYLLANFPERDLVIWGAGPVGKAFARGALALGRQVTAFVDLDPRKIGQEIHGATVVHPTGVQELKGALCLAAVGQSGAREEIREALRELGWVETVDFVAVA
jgi:glycosyltransferase involved in cell wall biosynthesis